MFREGEWVCFPFGNTVMIGSIIQTNHAITYIDARPDYNATLIVPTDEIVLCDEELYEDDILSLIDLALATKDKAWFEELTEQLRCIEATE